jgi:hypothetical protein
VTIEKMKKEIQECAICLEELDLESNTTVGLPCKCAHSTYHKTCITQMLQSGENKNFCPHCKTPYPLSNTAIVVIPIVGQRSSPIMYVFFVHIFSNSMMNIISLSMIEEYKENAANMLSKTVTILYFCKLVMNSCMVFVVKNDGEQINSNLAFSYTIQTMMFVLLISLLCAVKFNFNSGMLLFNNLGFSFVDLMFRIMVKNRVQGT